LNQGNPSIKKIEDINRLVPGDIFNGVSEIKHQEPFVARSFNPLEQGFFHNTYQQIPIRDTPETMRPSRNHQIAVNYKDYSQGPSVPSLGRAPAPKRSSKTLRKEEEEEYTISDE
jgi:hypothetical protein